DPSAASNEFSLLYAPACETRCRRSPRSLFSRTPMHRVADRRVSAREYATPDLRSGVPKFGAGASAAFSVTEKTAVRSIAEGRDRVVLEVFGESPRVKPRANGT